MKTKVIDKTVSGKVVSHCEAFELEDQNCFDVGMFGHGFRIVFEDGTSLEIQESSQSGQIAAWIAS